MLRRIGGGGGGMGAGWLAEHAMLGRGAAPKVLHPALSSHPAVMTRLFTEARAATASGDLEPESVVIVRDPEIASGERAKILGLPAEVRRQMAAFADFGAIASARDRMSRAGASTSRVLESVSRERRAVCR